MSEFMKTRKTGTGIRWRLLATASAIALLGSAYGASEASATAADSDRPQIWLELGGQLSRLDDGQEAFAPSLMAARPAIFTPSQKFERPPLYGIDEYGKISFQPENSDWLFSASIRYGRATSKRHVRQQTNPPLYSFSGYPKYASGNKFADTNARNSEHHFILDFEAGRDVGLGIFGKDGSSVFSVGVRFAQFGSQSNIVLRSDPDWHFYMLSGLPLGGVYHSNAATIRASRGFHGVGPTLSWNASASLAGNAQDRELTFDWGVNAALLFGRQHAKVHHQTTAHYHGAYYIGRVGHITTYSNTPPDQVRSRSVTVPNVGGFAGVSFRYKDAKVSFGYRADLFLNAIDGGIDARKNENRGFFGPYASISVGLGD